MFLLKSNTVKWQKLEENKLTFRIKFSTSMYCKATFHSPIQAFHQFEKQILTIKIESIFSLTWDHLSSTHVLFENLLQTILLNIQHRSTKTGGHLVNHFVGGPLHLKGPADKGFRKCWIFFCFIQLVLCLAIRLFNLIESQTWWMSRKVRISSVGLVKFALSYILSPGFP